jgi:hypothetical protein
LNAKQIRRFIKAGNATFTIQSVESGTHFTYVLAAPPRRKTHDRFARVLIGPDAWAYLGVVVNASLLPTRGSKVSEQAPSFLALAWFLRELSRTPDDATPAKVIFRHEGKCGRCGRPLTTPASVDTGLGPDCAEMLGVEHAARGFTPPSAPAEPRARFVAVGPAPKSLQRLLAERREEYAGDEDRWTDLDD